MYCSLSSSTVVWSFVCRRYAGVRGVQVGRLSREPGGCTGGCAVDTRGQHNPLRDLDSRCVRWLDGQTNAKAWRLSIRASLSWPRRHRAHLRSGRTSDIGGGRRGTQHLDGRRSDSSIAMRRADRGETALLQRCGQACCRCQETLEGRDDHGNVQGPELLLRRNLGACRTKNARLPTAGQTFSRNTVSGIVDNALPGTPVLFSARCTHLPTAETH